MRAGRLAAAALLLGPLLVCAAPLRSQEADPPPSAPRACPPPRPGRYLITARGRLPEGPVARLMQETWTAEGTVEGVLMERRGRTYRRVGYSGTWKELIPCAASVQRRLPPPGPPAASPPPSPAVAADAEGEAGESTTEPPGVSQPSELVIGPDGRPRFGIDVTPGSVISERWRLQPRRACSASTLDGVMVGPGNGFAWTGSRWAPLALIQRQTWQGGAVVGVAVTSLEGKGSVSAFRGQASVEESCLGTLRQQDAAGRTITGVLVAHSDGSGFAALRTQPDQPALLLMERVGPVPPSAPGP
ncbi:hypothetical protein EVJ50_01190 [Synechococcus sp. RSCCF101]|uniref:hypothetical protein n=1 Tax=Synechococcus sp. RSCCF101 TaxID=2511069 RepID=UPI0012470005|nr:hypothetical protein [Synechococcus sp. RSCCF101]QEY31072.1 hypothetical protein EVJ50_01190 [Synechococcus sp. RSCCF101]